MNKAKSYYDEKIEILDKNTLVMPSCLREYSPGPFILSQGLINPFPAPWYERLWKWLKSQFKPKGIEAPKVELVEDQEKKVRTYASFSGADCVVSVGDKIIGELQSIEWYKPTYIEHSLISEGNYIDGEKAKEYPIVIKAKYAMFNTTDLRDLHDANITVKFMNEYGQGMTRQIIKANTLREISGISIDSITLEAITYLIAESMTDYEPYKAEVKEYNVKWN